MREEENEDEIDFGESTSFLQDNPLLGMSMSQTQQLSIAGTAGGSRKHSKRSAESKKLVFLSNKVLEEVMNKNETTGTKIAMRILEIYKDKKINMDFKNV